MLVVRGIEVSTRIVHVEKLELSIQISLFARSTILVRLEHREPDSWKLLLYDRAGNVYELTRGDKLRFSKPVLAYRACPGNTSLFIEQRGDTILIKRFSELCGRPASSMGFCVKHQGSEYQRYIAYVFGLRRPELDTSLMRIPHMVYALHIGGSNVKIGIANGVKNIDRLYEQVFLHATVIAFVTNGVEARRLEDRLKRVEKISDRATLSHRLYWIREKQLDLSAQLREYVQIFSKYITSVLSSLGIEMKREKPLPVVRFCDKYLDLVRRSAIIAEEAQLDSLEGEFEIVDYAVGGLVLEQSSSQRIFVPYSLLRDRALRIAIPR